MTPPLPGQGPEGPIQIGVDLTLLDRMVLAALELRGTENEQNLQKNAAIFQNTNDPKLRAFKVHLAEDVFGRLARDAVAASKDASHAGLLWALGTDLVSWFDAGDLAAVEQAASTIMSRMAKRKMRVLSQGTITQEREDTQMLAVLKKWVNLNRVAKLAYLESRIKYSNNSYTKGPKQTVTAPVAPIVSPTAKPIIKAPDPKFPEAQAPAPRVEPPEVRPRSNDPETLAGGLGYSGASRTVRPVVQPSGDVTRPILPERAPAGGTLPPVGPVKPTMPMGMAPRPKPAVPGMAPGAGQPRGPVPARPAGAGQAGAPAPARAAVWKYMRAPDDVPDSRPYTFALDDGLKTPDGLKIVGAIVRGRKHKHEGAHCDDALRVVVVGPWTIMAVSDGAGSCKLGRVGSKVASDAAVELLRTKLASVAIDTIAAGDIAKDPVSRMFGGAQINEAAHALHEAMEAGYQAIQKATAVRQTPQYEKLLGAPVEMKDLSCTLLLALHTSVVFDGKLCDFVMGCQVGDGMIAAVSQTGSMVLLATPDTGEFSGETDFITSQSKLKPQVLWARTQATPINLRALMAMSDGLADDYFPNNPGMLRLFGDLCLNGVIQLDAGQAADREGAGRPDIAAFSEVCDRLTGEGESEKVRVYSFEAYAKAVNKTMDLLLEEPHELLAANAGIVPTGTPESQRLVEWLDSYQVRGSFDDRALAMIYKNKAHKDVQ